MKTSAFLAAAAGASFAHAHSTLMHLWVNGVDQGRGDTSATNGQYIRSPPNNNPLTDVTSSSMTCNVNNAAVAKTITVAPGDKVRNHVLLIEHWNLEANCLVAHA